MDTNYAERHIHALGLAKECAALGARIRTIKYVTGLAHAQLAHLFFADRSSAPRGRPPDSPDWYHNANLLNRAEASMFVSIYRRIRELGFGPAEALVGGYKHYRAGCPVSPRISFDRAFDLASHLDGLWIVREPNFSLLTCVTCTSQYVTSIGAQLGSNHECPFCRLVDRYQRDPRVKTSFPERASPDVGSLQFSMIALAKRMNA